MASEMNPVFSFILFVPFIVCFAVLVSGDV